MSTVALDTARTTERLSAFKTEIGATTPIDNIFDKNFTLDAMMKNKRMKDGGRQILYPIDSGTNSTVGYFSDYDVFNTSAQDTALTVVYPYINIGGTIVISWEEMRETAGNDHKIFDLVKHKRNNVLETIADTLNGDLYNATITTGQINSITATVDSTGAIGGLNQSTDSDWASVEDASTGSIASGTGITEMNNLYNDLITNKSKPDTIITTQALYEQYEAYMDVDVRYSNTRMAVNRGFKNLEFKTIPVIFDQDCTSGVIFMLDSNTLFITIDSGGNFAVDDFKEPVNQKAFVAKAYARLQLVCTKRNGQGKITGAT